MTVNVYRPASTRDSTALPVVADRATFEARLDALRIREKAHTRESDAIAAARRRLPMVEVNAGTPLIGPRGPLTLLDAFEDRRQLIAYYFMWHIGHSAADQCEGCMLYTSQVRELGLLDSRDVTFAVLCQGPYQESVRYREFMGWDVPWYRLHDADTAAVVSASTNGALLATDGPFVEAIRPFAD
jgi:predicted dithiol-disulfide oxidoreductase (DUF899 family)